MRHSDLVKRLTLPEPLDQPAPAVNPPKKPPMKGQRFEVLNTFVDTSIGDLSRAEIAVWLVLYRDSRNGAAQSAQSWIAQRAGVDKSTVVRALSSLRAKGLIQQLKRGGPNAGISLYRVRGTP